MNSTENIQEDYRNGLSKTASKTINNNYLLKPCAYQRARELKLPRSRLITRSQLRRFRLIFQIPALRKKYLIAGMFIITRALRTPRDVERRESGSMFCETIETIS